MDKFQDMYKTAKGEERASVPLTNLKTLWFNTGTLCNLSCENCYIESSPTNDRLSYITSDDVQFYLNEINEKNIAVTMLGFTGGEPFLNPNMMSILEVSLASGLDVLVLTNANRVVKKHQEALLELKAKYNSKLHLRVSLDHYSQEVHDQERGKRAFEKTMEQLKWLADKGFELSLAGRSLLTETMSDAKAGYQKVLNKYQIALDVDTKLVIFPEMKSGKDVPEITTACWGILKKRPEDQMCATERMIVKRKGENSPVVMPCTLLAYDNQFVMGHTLTEASRPVYLNHKFCAEFCVLGGASCSATK